MRHGRRRINPLYLGSKGEEGIKDIATILSLTGAINRSRGQQSRSRFGRRKHKFNFEHTEWRCWLDNHERDPLGFWRQEITVQQKGQAWKWRFWVISVSKTKKTKRQEAELIRDFRDLGVVYLMPVLAAYKSFSLAFLNRIWNATQVVCRWLNYCFIYANTQNIF